MWEPNIVARSALHDYLNQQYNAWLDLTDKYGKDDIAAQRKLSDLMAQKTMVEDLLQETIVFKAGKTIPKKKL